MIFESLWNRFWLDFNIWKSNFQVWFCKKNFDGSITDSMVRYWRFEIDTDSENLSIECLVFENERESRCIWFSLLMIDVEFG